MKLGLLSSAFALTLSLPAAALALTPPTAADAPAPHAPAIATKVQRPASRSVSASRSPTRSAESAPLEGRATASLVTLSPARVRFMRNEDHGGAAAHPAPVRAGGRHPTVINSPGEPKIDPSDLVNYKGFPNLGRVQYSTLEGMGDLTHKSLFGDGAAPDDVKQGREGDCFALATLASMAHNNPQSVEDLFKRTSNGQIAHDANGQAIVQLYGDASRHLSSWETASPGERLTRSEVPVDARIPLDRSDKPVFAKVRGDKMWVPIVEKALAIHYTAGKRDGYGSIDTGSAASAMEALTGKPAQTFLLKPDRAGADAMYDRLKAAEGSGQIVVGETLSPQAKEFPQRMADAQASGLITDKEAKTALASQHIVLPHDYSIFGVKTVDGQRFVQLRNPWGNHPGKRDPVLADLPRNKDGTFLMPLDKFTAVFFTVYVGASVAPRQEPAPPQT
jgi:hypothetical protein